MSTATCKKVLENHTTKYETQMSKSFKHLGLQMPEYKGKYKRLTKWGEDNRLFLNKEIPLLVWMKGDEIYSEAVAHPHYEFSEEYDAKYSTVPDFYYYFTENCLWEQSVITDLCWYKWDVEQEEDGLAEEIFEEQYTSYFFQLRFDQFGISDNLRMHDDIAENNTTDWVEYLDDPTENVIAIPTRFKDDFEAFLLSKDSEKFNMEDS